jgi:hypothetical protein
MSDVDPEHAAAGQPGPPQKTRPTANGGCSRAPMMQAQEGIRMQAGRDAGCRHARPDPARISRLGAGQGWHGPLMRASPRRLSIVLLCSADGATPRSAPPPPASSGSSMYLVRRADAGLAVPTLRLHLAAIQAANRLAGGARSQAGIRTKRRAAGAATHARHPASGGGLGDRRPRPRHAAAARLRGGVATARRSPTRCARLPPLRRAALGDLRPLGLWRDAAAERVSRQGRAPSPDAEGNRSQRPRARSGRPRRLPDVPRADMGEQPLGSHETWKSCHPGGNPSRCKTLPLHDAHGQADRDRNGRRPCL